MEWEGIYERLATDMEDSSAWTSLATRIRTRSRRDLAARGQHVVEDVVADTCSAVAIMIANAHGPETFHGFVLGHYLNARRKALKAATCTGASLDESYLEIVPSTQSDGSNYEVLEQVQQALDRLPPRERGAIMLRYYEDLPASDIGHALGTSECNARQILSRGLNRLRRHLTPCSTTSRSATL
jgi:RNA polymerase sigma factor (sigma-70 family)